MVWSDQRQGMGIRVTNSLEHQSRCSTCLRVNGGAFRLSISGLGVVRGAFTLPGFSSHGGAMPYSLARLSSEEGRSWQRPRRVMGTYFWLGWGTAWGR